MRETHVCPKCRHNRILAVNRIPDFNEHGAMPLRAALVSDGIDFFGNEKIATVGVLQSCICRRCGYTELYTLGVEHIVVDGKHVTELVGSEPEGPYR